MAVEEMYYLTETSILSEFRDLLSVADLAKIFSVSKGTIYEELQRGKFGTPIKIGREYKVPKCFILKRFYFDYQ